MRDSETKCKLCNGYGGWMDGDGPLAFPVDCPQCSDVEPTARNCNAEDEK